MTIKNLDPGITVTWDVLWPKPRLNGDAQMLFSGHVQGHDAGKLRESGVGGDSLFQTKINCQVEQEAQDLVKV